MNNERVVVGGRREMNEGRRYLGARKEKGEEDVSEEKIREALQIYKTAKRKKSSAKNGVKFLIF